MKFNEFSEHYRGAQVHFRNRLENIVIAIEILDTVNAPLLEVKSALELLYEELQQLIKEQDRIAGIVEDYMAINLNREISLGAQYRGQEPKSSS